MNLGTLSSTHRCRYRSISIRTKSMKKFNNYHHPSGCYVYAYILFYPLEVLGQFVMVTMMVALSPNDHFQWSCSEVVTGDPLVFWGVMMRIVRAIIGKTREKWWDCWELLEYEELQINIAPGRAWELPRKPTWHGREDTKGPRKGCCYPFNMFGNWLTKKVCWNIHNGKCVCVCVCTFLRKNGKYYYTHETWKPTTISRTTNEGMCAYMGGS